MRTTVVLEDDVATAVERLRRERGLGLSEALNELARAGMAVKPVRNRFHQQTHEMHARIDVTDVAEAIELIEGPSNH